MKSLIKAITPIIGALLFLLFFPLTSCDGLLGFFEPGDPIAPEVEAVTAASTTPYSCILTVGDTAQITVNFTPSNATDQTVSWDSSEASVASVSSDGHVTALTAGSTVITATTNDGGFTDTTAVTVTASTIAVTGITLSPKTKSLVVGGDYTLTAAITPADATDQAFTWSSSDTGKVTVDGNGKISAVAVGSSIITITSDEGNFTDTCAVTVVEAVVTVTGISLNQSSATLERNNTFQFVATIAPADATDQDVTWTTSNSAIASVSSDGLVTAEGVGTATITVTTHDQNRTATATITVVTTAVTGVSLDRENATIAKGDGLQLTATITPSNATNTGLTWSSSNDGVATVNSSGLVTGVTDGSATIIVTTSDGSYTDSIEITVKKDVTLVSLSPESYILEVGDVLPLTADVFPSNATNPNLVWTSTDSSLASVSSSGVVTAVSSSSGPVTITAAAEDFSAVYDTCMIYVVPSAASDSKDISLSFTYAPSGMAGNIYSIWLDNKITGAVQNIFTCRRAITTRYLTNGSNVLAYWRSKIFDSNGVATVDVISGATWARTDFTITDGLVVTDSYLSTTSNLEMTVDPAAMGDQFVIYFEMDESWETNDWFTDSDTYDQPSALYAAAIDLTDSSTTTYTLEPVGWTTMYNNTVISGLGTLPASTYISEIRYFTHHKVDNGDGTYSFGSADPDNSSIRCIAGITVTISDTP